MDLRAYAEFVGFAVVVILIPRPDFAVTVKNTLAGGARRGRATAFGISTSNASAQAALSALRPEPERARVEAPRAHGFRQGLLSNITNPKVLAFYVAVLPQLVTTPTSTPPAVLLVFALTHAVLALAWLLVVVGGVEYARRWLASTRARRMLDGITSLFLAGFAGRLALERA